MNLFESKLANAKLAIATMFVVLVISIILNIILAIGLVVVPNHLKVYQQHCDGTTQIIDPQKVSKARLQWFVNHTWVKLNSWVNNGKTDSSKAIQTVGDQLTPRFKQTYSKTLAALANVGLFDNYSLATIALDNDPETNIEQIGDGWLVRVSYVSNFYFNPYGNAKDYQEEVKTADVSVQRIQQTIVFKVVQYPNHWGLALDQIVDSKTIVDSGQGKAKEKARK